VLISLVRSVFISAIICSQISFGMSELGAVVAGMVTISGFLVALLVSLWMASQYSSVLNVMVSCACLFLG